MTSTTQSSRLSILLRTYSRELTPLEKYKVLKGQPIFDGVDQFERAIYNGLSSVDPSIRDVQLSELHQKIKGENVNSFRLAAFKQLNRQIGEYDHLLEVMAGPALSEILGPDVLVQTKLNLSIQLPGDSTSQLDLHSDCWSGDSAFQVNFWLPLTSCYSSNSMFLFSRAKSLECINRLVSDPLLSREALEDYVEQGDFLSLEKGEAVIFNPGLIHGNLVNETDQTRVSINVRFKGFFSPDAEEIHVSRSAGPYYRLFRLSRWTELAMELDKANRRHLAQV